MTRVLVACLLAASMVPAFTVPASSDDGSTEDCPVFYLEAVGMVCRLDNGLYQGHYADGTPYTTHGADPKPDEEEDISDETHERIPRCATDHYQHVLYGYPAGETNDLGQVEEQLRSVIYRMNWILNQDALESGGVEADFKVLCDEYGLMRVDSFVGPASTSDFGAVVSAARSAGFRDSNADYTIFYAANHPSACGVGHISYDDRLIENNWNNRGGDYGVTYKGCWAGRTPMHENGHNQGAVQTSSPDSDGSGHCRKGHDIMCYPPTNMVLLLCPDRIRYDCQHDSYFDAAPEPGSYLATHWNIGSRLNRFVAFSDTDPRPPNETPNANFTLTQDDRNVTVDGAASTDPDGDPLHHIWTFGDGTKIVGNPVTHEYAEPGRYTVTLTVSDGNGGIGSTEETVAVIPDVPPRVTSEAFTGRIGCAIGISPISTADLCRDDTTQNVFPVPLDEGLTAVHVTLQWGPADLPGGVITTREMGFSWRQPAGLEGASGQNPVVSFHEIEPGSTVQLVGADGLLEVRPSGISGPVKDQEFTVCVTALYGDANLPEEPTCSD